MHKIRDRAEPSNEHGFRRVDFRLKHWDGVYAFKEVVRSGSFRSAAKILNLSPNTLRRRIEDFEREIGITLMTRHVDGIRLTEEGHYIMQVVQRMDAAALDIARVRHLGGAMQGEVRIGITEGLGTFWIAPRLVEFRQAYPGLLIDLRCVMHPADILRLETDISVQITWPTEKDLKVVKIGRIHAMPFAAQSYLDTYGVPHRLDEIDQHHLVLQVADQVASAEIFSRLFHGRAQIGTVGFRTNVSSTHYWMIARGGGIGVLPTYTFALGANVVPIDVEGLRFSQDILLVYHPDAAKIPRVRRVIDWLIGAFASTKYPWFADDFIHPRDLPREIDETPVSQLFEGFTDFI